MKKIIRFSIPIIVACLMLGIIFFMVGASNHTAAALSSSSTEGGILVTTLDDELNIDGDCSLREAITAANDNTPVDACLAGDAVITDTITFDVAGIITVTSQLSVNAGGPLIIDGGDVITTSGGGTTRVWWVDQSSDLTLQDLDVVNGLSGSFDNGAGLYNNRGSVIVDHCLFSGNTFGGISNYGGGIFNWYGNLTVLDSEFKENGGNYDETYGGGVATWGGIVEIFRSNFQLNRAHGLRKGGYEGYAGGGMSVFQSKVTIQDSSFISNEGYYWGGGIAQQGQSILNIIGTTFISNTTSLGGGGIYSGPSDFPVTGTITVTNSTFSGNDAFYGAGIDIERGTGFVFNSTFSGNIADYIGGLYMASAGILTINNTIVAYNRPGGDCFGAITDGGHNLDSDGTCYLDPANGSLPNTDPLQGPLQDNGGPTWTHALLFGSPAIDAGDYAQCPLTDQRGVIRPRDGDGDGLSVCDIGSYEVESLPVSPTLVTISGASEGLLGQVNYFTANVEPVSTTLPITYTWQAQGQQTIINTSGLTDTVSFTWEILGTQIITVTASNIEGSVSDSHVITITDVPISGLFAHNDSPTLLGEATTFTANITSGTNVIFTWDFGDDSTGIGETITHTYIITGVYTATVTAANSVSSLTETTLVRIATSIYPIYLPVVIKSSGELLTPSNPSAFLGDGEWIGLIIVGIIGIWNRKG